MDLTLLKYLKSFSEGRVRLRHPALRDKAVADLTRERMAATPGALSVECNTLSGSVLLLYDHHRISKERLITMGTAWARYLDAVRAGQKADPPSFEV